MNEIKIGQRCFFGIEYICSFGKVISIDGDKLRIFADNGRVYDRLISEVILL